MEESLWCEKTSSSVISTLPVWIIEYAWTNRMTEVLQVLGPPLWLEGDRSSLTLKDPCSIRVTAAESWIVIRARDIKHFEHVMEFLDVTHTLLPQLVTPIKHMKIMFGLKTLVIMWMLWDDQSAESITDKIVKFFPDSLPQYHRSSHRHMKLMQKTQRDFRNFVQLLARKPEMRKNYIRNLMEEQYGERYIMKLEERLLHYLEELNKALPQPTYIDQVLKQSGQLKGREELLQQLFTCNSACTAAALKKLLRCAIASHIDHKSTEMCKQQKGAPVDGPVFGPLCVALTPSLEEAEEDWLSQASGQSSWLNRDKSLEKQRTRLKKKHVLDQTDNHPCVLEEQCPQMTETGFVAAEKKTGDELTAHLCSRHGKRMASILQECSEELRSQDGKTSLMQVECTPLSPHPPLLHSSPHRPTSGSPLHDSSSTNISLSSQPETFSYLSADEERHVVPSQPMASLPISPGQENNSGHFLGQKSNIALSIQVSPSPGCSAQLVTPSPSCSVQPSLSQTSPSSTNFSPFPENNLTQRSSLTGQECSLMLSFKEMCPESSYHHLGSSSSSSFATPAVIQAPSQNDAQVSLDSYVILESSSALAGKLRLSSETQAFLLACKWLQPQVKLYRLSRHECHQATLPNRAPEQSSEEEDVDEDVLFDVNSLYSDSESDTQDSDDSDYVPSKKCRYR
ncbi:uncharacterized protein LOC128606920 isoform X2 [Ictalurus furcatus]|uniref:uncharacterized protein LOC128606920 isoform X2 n=1 Tax=Ictalurus furcatus TaxID=66913 RepID=UPI00234FFB4B|nr:uncharacterized protein LOC128606920 isoform X2 [Ictalurus furcatus]